jgi:hypothetical protein
VLAAAPPAVQPPKTSAPLGKAAAPAPAQQQRPASMPPRAAPVPTIKTVDKVLIYTASVAALVGVGYNFYVFFMVLKPAIDQFQP